jgi:hypothetical protein
MIRAVYTNGQFLVEELCGWACVVAGFLLAGGAGEKGLGFLLVVLGAGVSYHAHRRAFRYVMSEAARRNEDD